MYFNKHPSKAEVIFLYLAGLLQGISFSIVPGASNFLTAKSGLNFSTYEYGNLFILMIFGAIFTSFFGSILAKSIGSKKVLLFGLFSNMLSMGLFAAESFFLKDLFISYPLFLFLMFLLGCGFGASLCTLNHFAFQFFPKKQNTAITALHSFLGIGSALGPLLFLFFQKAGAWFLAPGALSILFFFLTVGTALSFSKKKPEVISSRKKTSLPVLFWIFCLTALCYGFSETVFGNWGMIFLHKGKDLSLEAASYGLALFWGAVTFTRIAITFLVLKIKAQTIYITLAPLILSSLLFIYLSQGTTENILSFLVAGIGCSGFLPLTFSLAEKSFPKDSQKAAGFVSGFYMAGYGLASWGVGAMLKQHSLVSIFEKLAFIIIILIILTAIIDKKTKKLIRF